MKARLMWCGDAFEPKLHCREYKNLVCLDVKVCILYKVCSRDCDEYPLKATPTVYY